MKVLAIIVLVYLGFEAVANLVICLARSSDNLMTHALSFVFQTFAFIVVICMYNRIW